MELSVTQTCVQPACERMLRAFRVTQPTACRAETSTQE